MDNLFIVTPLDLNIDYSSDEMNNQLDNIVIVF